ncbi:MAG: methyltransferase domain-containing protein [Bacteroidota bacterium]
MYSSAEKWQEFYSRLEAKARLFLDSTTGLISREFSTVVPCSICGSTNYRPRAVKIGFTYVICQQCGFVYINPQPTSGAIHRIYNDEEVRRFFFRELLLPYVERDQKPEFETRLHILKEMIRSPGPRLLDIGCAAGLFLQLANSNGFQVEGLELNKQYVDYIRANRPIRVHQKPLEEMKFLESSFDVVTMWDVLEHVPDPRKTVGEVHRIVAKDGIFALTTINHDCINEHLLKDRWRYYMPPDHLCSFTPDLLRTLLANVGFEIVKIQHQYMFEVLAEQYFKFLTLPGTGYGNKLKKVVYVLLNKLSQAVFNTLKSGDIITVYAKKYECH